METHMCKNHGSVATSPLSDNTEMERRVSLAQKAFHSLRKKPRDQRLTVQI